MNHESTLLSMEPLLPIFFLLVSLPSTAAATCHPSDQASLSSFSSAITAPTPLNWSSADCCHWEGIACDDAGRVVGVSLPSRTLRGHLPESLLNLTSLTHFNISNNIFSGEVPAGFFALESLRAVDLSYNEFSGEITDTRIAIEIVNLSSNRFKGTINPTSFSGLIAFNVSNNTFTGQFPSSICALSKQVKILDFSLNRFNGSIPVGLGECSSLEILSAGFNDLTGKITDDIFSIISLTALSLPRNSLTGAIPDNIAVLGNLTILELNSNNLAGEIPRNIGRLEKLEQLLLHVNNLNGKLPAALSNCTNLSVLILRVNSFLGELSSFNFSSFSKLTTVDLGNNGFTGTVPHTLYSCTSLTAVRLAFNNLMGEISPEISSLKDLSFLSLSRNNLGNLKGALHVLAECKSLRTLILFGNFKNEELPGRIDDVANGSFSSVQIFSLGGSSLIGKVPEWLVYMKDVRLVDFSSNRLVGPVPKWLGKFERLFYLDLSNNSLTGEVPSEIGGLPALRGEETVDNGGYLPLPVFAVPYNFTVSKLYNQLSHLPRALSFGLNSLNGEIPSEIGNLKSLHELNLSHNLLSGRIPEELSKITYLEKLDLSYNGLTGEIPSTLENLSFLSFFSVAFNHLIGVIPTGGQFDTFPNSSFEGNSGLFKENEPRGSVGSEIRSRSRSTLNRVVGVVVGLCIGIGLFFWVVMLLVYKRRGRETEEKEEELDLGSSAAYSHIESKGRKEDSIVLLFPGSNESKDLTAAELIEATRNFDQANIIGCGGFGLVYKAVLSDGTNLAVKKFTGDMGLMERELKAEVETLATARHENLLSLRGYMVHDGIHMLLYPYMENGSLDYWLHEKPDGAGRLDWPTRLNILIGASRGLAFMHLACDPHIVHRDIKSSNILLDNNFDARVADFGLARLILPYRSHVTTELVGTLGYIPPEYGQVWAATLRGDVYSFGVVMLELLTRRRPVEVFREKKSRELIAWVREMKREGREEEVIDPLMRKKGFEREIAQVMSLACLCVSVNPLERPGIQEVVDWLSGVDENREGSNVENLN